MTIQQSTPSAMKTIVASNVNIAYTQGIRHILNSSTVVHTRNGMALRCESALTTHYIYPNQRMLFSAARNANPFFHLFEALWMLGGRNDVEFVSKYVKTMANFSDDGVTLNGAYGHRWRQAFGVDQIALIIKELKANPQSRRVVLQMWDSRKDLEYGMTGGKDSCCNLMCKFAVVNGKLNMTVMCRSNDMLLGGYGANAVHFSFLQEYIADCVGLDIGFYEQISLDAHLYTAELYGDKLWNNVQEEVLKVDYVAALSSNPYNGEYYSPLVRLPVSLFTISPVTLRVNKQGHYVFNDPKAEFGYSREALVELFDAELPILLDKGPSASYYHPYFRNLIVPLMEAYDLYKSGDVEGAYNRIVWTTSQTFSPKPDVTFDGPPEYVLDIEQACCEWLFRKLPK